MPTDRTANTNPAMLPDSGLGLGQNGACEFRHPSVDWRGSVKHSFSCALATFNSLPAVLGWCGALAVHKQLALIRSISEVTNSPSPTSDQVNQQTQDGTTLSHSQSQNMAKSASSAIKLSTLHQLLQSTNPEIRDASTKVVVERALQSSTAWRLLRQQLRSKTDFKARDQALCILVQFGPTSTYDERVRRPESRKIEYEEFFHPATVVAVVDCLCNMLPAARQAENQHQHHDSAEADALWVAHKMVSNNGGLALKAGLVRKWLVNYPLSVQDLEKTKVEIIKEMVTAYEYADDYERLLCCVLFDLAEGAEGRRQMAKYGIGDPGAPYGMVKVNQGRNWGVRHQYEDHWASERRTGGWDQGRGFSEDYATTAALMQLERTQDDVPQNEAVFASIAQDDFAESGPEFSDEHAPLLGRDERVVRRREESAEERALRSRRREAMVFAEGGGPIRREDIIESQRENTMDENEEEEIEQLMEELGEEIDEGTNEMTGRVQMTWPEYLARLRPDGSLRM